MAYETRFTDIKIELMNEEIIYKDSPGRVIVFDRSVIVEEIMQTPTSKTYGFFIPNNTLRKLEWNMDRNPKRNEPPTVQKEVKKSAINLD